MNTFLKNKPKIKEKLAKIPQAGIYYYKDKANRIILGFFLSSDLPKPKHPTRLG